MLNVEHVEVMNFEAAVRGMRNPMNSWEKSDSGYGCGYDENDQVLEWCKDCDSAIECDKRYSIGDNDLDLMKKLVKAGTDHRKFLRQIVVSMDITAPLFWWKEFDTYKVGTVANSCSTMHKIHARPLEISDFSIETVEGVDFAKEAFEKYIDIMNSARNAFLEFKDKDCWRIMIEMLPTSYNQKRTVTMNYEVCLNIYNARKNHKLKEWHTLCDEILKLPFFKSICEDVI